MSRAEAILRVIASELTMRKAELEDSSIRVVTFRVKTDKQGIPRAVEFETAKHKEL